jgi:hypothetical protein
MAVPAADCTVQSYRPAKDDLRSDCHRKMRRLEYLVKIGLIVVTGRTWFLLSTLTLLGMLLGSGTTHGTAEAELRARLSKRPRGIDVISRIGISRRDHTESRTSRGPAIRWNTVLVGRARPA